LTKADLLYSKLYAANRLTKDSNWYTQFVQEYNNKSQSNSFYSSNKRKYLLILEL